MIEVSQYCGKDRAMWNDFLKRTRNATFLLNRAYMDYHSDRFEDCSLLAKDRERLVAVLPANLQGDVLYSHQGLTYGGWLTPLKHFDATVMMEVMDAACGWARGKGIKSIVYKPVPHIYHSYPAEEDLYALFRHGAQLVESNISTAIDLARALPFDRGNKSGLNVARKAGIEVGESNAWSDYWILLEQVLQEQHAAQPVHSVAEMQLLHSRFPENIVLYTATLQGEMVAGVVIYYTAAVAHCQYIASSAPGRKYKALVLLFYHLIAMAVGRGCRYFDFGTSNEDHGRILNDGLLQQKSRLGGRGIVYNTFQLNL